jgi:formate hydrogenlyase subunit 3/multisubunit Na+/H+ antiporter MnhD subunit
MLDPVPVPLQALIWPLLGAILILIGRRFLPNWLRRLVALAAALASLAVLWSLRTGSIERVDVLWEPLNLFRMGPNLHPDSLALLVGITLVWLTAATVLGVRGAQPQSTAWHGLILAVLAGCLAMTMATNLITLAIASALLDMALLPWLCLSRTMPAGLRGAWPCPAWRARS